MSKYILFPYIEVNVQILEQTKLNDRYATETVVPRSTHIIHLIALCYHSLPLRCTPYLVLLPNKVISVRGKVGPLLKICINSCIMQTEVDALTYRSSSSYNKGATRGSTF